MECEYCQKVFSTKSNLSSHQKSAKYCLELQGEHKEEKNFTCEYCNKVLTQQKSLDVHIISCKEKKKKIEMRKDSENSLLIKKLEYEIVKLKKNEKENLQKKDEYHSEKMKEKDALLLKETELFKEKIAEKDEYITKLEAKLEKMEEKLESKFEKLESVFTMAIEAKTLTASSASTTNNTTTNITVTNNNVLNLSKEHVNKVLKDHLDYDVVYAGQAGFAKFVVDKMLKGPDGKLTYKCVDPSRQMFEFIDESGETVRDMRAEKLIQSLLDGDALKIGLDAAAKGWNTDDRQLNNARTETFGPRVNEYSELNRNNTVFRNKVSSLTT